MRKRLVAVGECVRLSHIASMWANSQIKLTKYGSPASAPQLSKEDERAAALARRAQQGDYDDGMFFSIRI